MNNILYIYFKILLIFSSLQSLNLNKDCDNNKYLFFENCKNNRLSSIILGLNDGRFDINSLDEDNRNCFYYLIKYNLNKINDLKYTLKFLADYYKKNCFNQNKSLVHLINPLDFISKDSPFIIALLNNIDLCKFLINLDYKILYLKDNNFENINSDKFASGLFNFVPKNVNKYKLLYFNGNSLFNIIVGFANCELILFCLEKLASEKVNLVNFLNEESVNHLKETPLMIAAALSNNKRIIKLLHNYGARSDLMDLHGRSALIYSCLNYNLNIFKSLISIGKLPPLRDIDNLDILCYALKYENYELFQSILKDDGLSFFFYNSNNNYLSYLYSSQSFNYLKCLLQNLKNGKNFSPLIYYNIINGKNLSGRTPFIQAIIDRNEPIIKLLFDHNALTFNEEQFLLLLKENRVSDILYILNNFSKRIDFSPYLKNNTILENLKLKDFFKLMVSNIIAGNFNNYNFIFSTIIDLILEDDSSYNIENILNYILRAISKLFKNDYNLNIISREILDDKINTLIKEVLLNKYSNNNIDEIILKNKNKIDSINKFFVLLRYHIKLLNLFDSFLKSKINNIKSNLKIKPYNINVNNIKSTLDNLNSSLFTKNIGFVNKSSIIDFLIKYSIFCSNPIIIFTTIRKLFHMMKEVNMFDLEFIVDWFNKLQQNYLSIINNYNNNPGFAVISDKIVEFIYQFNNKLKDKFINKYFEFSSCNNEFYINSLKVVLKIDNLDNVVKNIKLNEMLKNNNIYNNCASSILKSLEDNGTIINSLKTINGFDIFFLNFRYLSLPILGAISNIIYYQFYKASVILGSNSLFVTIPKSYLSLKCDESILTKLINSIFINYQSNGKIIELKDVYLVKWNNLLYDDNIFEVILNVF